MPVFDAKDLSVSISGRQILQKISFSVEIGSWVGLLGPNGAGKTTLLRTMAGFLPYSNTLTLKGQEVRDWRTRDRAKTLAFVRQSHTLSFDFTVIELVLLGRMPHKSLLSLYEKSDYARVEKALCLLDLEGFEYRNVSSLSGGEQQRVFLAQALVQEARVLLLDEPTTHLDVSHQFEFMEHVREFTREGRTVIGAFHDLELASRFCDSLIILKDGQIAAEGIPSEVLTEDSVRRIFNMDARVIKHGDGDLSIRYEKSHHTSPR